MAPCAAGVERDLLFNFSPPLARTRLYAGNSPHLMMDLEMESVFQHALHHLVELLSGCTGRDDRRYIKKRRRDPIGTHDLKRPHPERSLNHTLQLNTVTVVALRVGGPWTTAGKSDRLQRRSGHFADILVPGRIETTSKDGFGASWAKRGTRAMAATAIRMLVSLPWTNLKLSFPSIRPCFPA